MNGSLKKNALNAVVWNAIQKYGSLLIAFITNIILARLLLPEDFGLVGLLAVFLAVATTITESGFSSALIQRKNTAHVDYCTVFYWNIAMSVIIVLLLYCSAPFIARYFDKPILCDILRLQSVILIINSFSTVQIARLSKQLKFKALTLRTIIGTAVGALVGIVLALTGYGVWSLVWQGIAAALSSVVLLWITVDWKPSFLFSWKSFREMFGFGSLIFVSSLCNTLYINIQSFIIGRYFSIRDLGYYTQAKKLETIPVDGTSSVLNQVLFPVYASIADDRERMINVVRKNIQIITFITFPMMLMLIIVARPLILILFGNIWEPSIGIFKILCVMGMFSPLNMANTEIFKSIGRSDIYLTLQTIKRIVNIAILLWLVQFGLYPMIWGMAITGITSYTMNLIFTHKVFCYKYKEQLKDIIPNLTVTIISGIIPFIILTAMPHASNWLQLMVGGGVFIMIYFSLSIFCKLEGGTLIRNIRK